MADRVLIRQVVTTVEARSGTEVWLDDCPRVAGMVAGGYWEIVDRIPGKTKGGDGGADTAGPGGGEGGAEPDSGA